MELRLVSNPADLRRGVEALKAGFTVRSVSDVYRMRGSTALKRVYVDAVPHREMTPAPPVRWQVTTELDALADVYEPTLPETGVSFAELNYREGIAHLVAALRERAEQLRGEQ